MSVLNKKPFIQSFIESLSSSDKTALLNAINGSGTSSKYSLVLRNLSVSTPIEKCSLETKTRIYNCYKIYKNYKITFLTYGQGQDMGIYQIDYPYYEKELKGKINEPLSINELRRYLEEAGATIDSGEIDSGTATSGQVLTANGSGGASWQTPTAIAGNPESDATAVLSKITIGNTTYSVLTLPADLDDTKTYTLKIVNGVFTAVEDTE